MIYEIVVKLFGTDILWALTIISCTLGFKNELFTIQTQMRQPITQEAENLVKHGLNLRIEHSVNIIINDEKSYTMTVEKSLTWKDGWIVNGKVTKDDQVQTEMGSALYSFPYFKFDKNDNIFVFVKSSILPDEEFTVSTGLKTQVLWNFYVPRYSRVFVYENGSFIPK